MYQSALVLELDTESGAARTCLEYKTPIEACAGKDSSSVFHSSTLIDDLLYTCTSTEILVYRVPSFALVNYISLSCFNDLHHVAPTSDGALLVAVTGLDMVVKITPRGELIQEWSVLPGSPWDRFSRSVDYRKVDTTKPHQSHPNFVFELDRAAWVTRFFQKDAVCLTDRERRIDIAVESPHDGLVRDEKIYFTIVDGRVLIADAKTTLKTDRIIDFKTMDDPNALLGWCRGVLPVDEDHMWVGFTRIRKTRIRENVLWVRRLFKEGMTEKPTHISLYDVKAGRCVKEIDLERHGMNTVFSILPAPGPAGASKSADGS